MEEVQRATLAAAGLAQFEKKHQPVQTQENLIECITCGEDWPCERMGIVLVSQSLSVLMKMIPSGNLQSVLSRFSSSQQ